MQALLEQNLSSEFLLIAPPPMARGAWVSDEELLRTSQQLGARYRLVAERLSIHFADAGEWDISLTFDGVHFSENGHFAFVKGIQSVLNNLFHKIDNT